MVIKSNMLLWVILLLIVGVFALYKGAQLLVEHASHLAGRLGVSTVVVGLSVVTLGSITPELVIGVTSSLSGANDLILGNALGSSILKVGLIFGIAAFITPLAVQKSTLRHEFPWLMLAAVLAFFLAFDLSVSRVDALILLLLAIIFQWYSVKISRKEVLHRLGKKHIEQGRASLFKNNRHLWRMILGIALIILGAKLFVDSSLYLAPTLGVSEFLIGILVIAFGASLPEIVVTLSAAARHEPSLGIGDIIGSSVMNIFFVVGVAALIRPIAIHPDMLIFDFPTLIFFTILVSLLFKTHHRLSRLEGGVLVAGYILYAIYSIKFWG